MSLIGDLRDAVSRYETDECLTEIVNFSIIGGGGTVLNVGEICQFKVKVTNEGHLNMTNVKVRAKGTSFADVALSSGSFSDDAFSGAFTLDAHQSHTTGFFRAKAKIATNGAQDIVTARIDSWDANFNHILIDHTGAGVAEGKLNKDINQN